MVRLQVRAAIDPHEWRRLVTGLALAARSEQHIVPNGSAADIQLLDGWMDGWMDAIGSIALVRLAQNPSSARPLAVALRTAHLRVAHGDHAQYLLGGGHRTLVLQKRPAAIAAKQASNMAALGDGFNRPTQYIR